MAAHCADRHDHGDVGLQRRAPLAAQDFKNGRQFSAWLGLVPMRHSSGGRARLGRISYRGDGYLRTLLIQGARSSLQRAKAVAWEKATPEQCWIQDVERRLPFGKALVAPPTA